MLAYANPEDRTDEKKRADGYGISRFNKTTGEVTFECYKRFTDVTTNKDTAQFPGWPITFKARDNDGRNPSRYLSYNVDLKSPVLQVINETSGDILYTTRMKKSAGKLPIYSTDPHTIMVGKDKPQRVLKTGLKGD